jgi:hypothetical protein
MDLKRILSSLMLLLLLSSCASTSEGGGDDFDEDAASSETDDGSDTAEASDSGTPEAEPENAPEKRAEEPGLDDPEKIASENAPIDKEPSPKVAVPTTKAAPDNKHKILSRSFDRAGLLAEMSDFDILDDPQPLNRCLASRPAEPDNLMEMVIRQMAVSYPGTPSFGPLFPGTPPKVETALVIGKNNGWVTASQLTNDKRRVFELHRLGNTLIIKILPNQFGIYQDFGNPAEVWIRKARDGNLFFKVFKIDEEQNRAEAFVGYCFKRG